MSKFGFLAVLLILCGVLVNPLYAQTSPTTEPIYYLVDGYLYQWDLTTGETTQLTTEGYIHRLQHSPTSNSIAFNWQYTRDPMIDNHYAGMDYAGSDIYLLENSELTNLTNDDRWVRSDVSWSASGNHLGWWQAQIYEGSDYEYLEYPQINIYEFATDGNALYGSTIGGIDAGEAYVPQPSLVGNGYGIAGYGVHVSIGLHFNNGSRGSSTIIADYEESGDIELVDVMTPQGSFMGIYYKDYGQWDLYNPMTGTSTALVEDTIEIRSNEAASLRWRYHAPTEAWQLFDAQNNLLIEMPSHFIFEGYPIFEPYNLAISSDGSGAAYYQEGVIYTLLVDGSTQSLNVEGVHDIAWGAEGWYLAEDVTMPTIEPEDAIVFSSENCDPTDLSIGQSGYIRGQQDTRFYQHINPRRLVLGPLNENTQVTILDGPLCFNDGSHQLWWQIEAYGVTGWAQLNDLAE